MASHQGCRNSIKSVRCATGGDQIGRMRVKRVLLFLFGWLLLSTLQLTAAHAEMRKDRLTITTVTGRHDFSVEVTESEAEKAMGLMFRQSLGKRAGMLFPHANPSEITMWMKNTYISLDMIFIRKDGRVHRIEKGTEPFSERIVASQGKVSAVLEVVAGVADEIGLKAGDRVEHKFFLAPR